MTAKLILSNQEIVGFQACGVRSVTTACGSLFKERMIWKSTLLHI
jgi:hypothetical protein